MMIIVFLLILLIKFHVALSLEGVNVVAAAVLEVAVAMVAAERGATSTI